MNEDEPTFERSPSGATLTCRFCGTQYDNFAVDESDYVPPVGDGCDKCDPQIDIEEVAL